MACHSRVGVVKATPGLYQTLEIVEIITHKGQRHSTEPRKRWKS